jgi:hypothetical protein
MARPRPQTGPVTVELPPTAAGEPVNTNHLETGMLDMGMDDRFSGSNADGPALEVDSLTPQRGEVPSPRPQPRPQQRPQQQQPKQAPKPEPPRESPAEQRQRRLRDLARYPAPPHKLIGVVPYFFRVYGRRRELVTQVANLTRERKRLELALDDAMCTLGQSLFDRREEPNLQPLAAQLRVVGETADEVGAKAAAAKRSGSEHKAELAVLEQQLADARAHAEPVAAREQVLRQAVDGHRAQLKRREMLARKADAELRALSTANSADASRLIPPLEAERDGHLHEMHGLQRKLQPLEDELATVRSALAQHSGEIEQLDARRQRLSSAIGRDPGREKIASGGMHSALREALRSLANAALKYDLAAILPEEQRAAADAIERAATHRESEELMRAAVSCYDERAYERGMHILAGVLVATFLLFVLLIVF